MKRYPLANVAPCYAYAHLPDTSLPMPPMRTFVLLLFVTLIPAINVNAAGFDDGVVIRSAREDGTPIGLVIDRRAILSTREWDPRDGGEPPLSLMEAYRIAYTWARKEYVRYDDVSIREISLSRWHRWDEGERWYYRFDLTPVIDDNALHGPGNWAAVLMDGTVIGTTELR